MRTFWSLGSGWVGGGSNLRVATLGSNAEPLFSRPVLARQTYAVGRKHALTDIETCYSLPSRADSGKVIWSCLHDGFGEHQSL